MDKKRLFGISLFSSLFGIVFSSVVSAYYIGSFNVGYQIQQGIEFARTVTAPVFETMFGTYESSEFFWTKVLLFILLFVVVRFSLEKIEQFKKNKAVILIISFVASVFAIRYISESSLIGGILLPYSVMGVAILTVLPFLIFFWFVHKSGESPTWRKLAWVFFGVVFGVLWMNRFSELSPIGNQIYGWTLVAMAVVFVFDRKIHEYFNLNEAKRLEREHIKNRVVDFELQLDNLYKYGGDSKEVKERIKKLEDLKKEWYKKL